MTFSPEKCRQAVLIMYTFCYFKFLVLYMDCVINSNLFLLNYNNKTCMYGMAMHLSIDGSTAYFAQP